MEENENYVEGTRKNSVALWIIIILIVALLGLGVGYLFHDKVNQDKPTNNESSEKENKEEDSKKYLTILDGKKILKSDLELTENAIINSSKEDEINGLLFVDVEETDFQFETHYLFCFNKDGKLIFEARDFRDSDNDDNRYKFNGKFEYDSTTTTLTFFTNLFLGDGEESSGTAFNDKEISELTSEEKTILGNYSDEVKYTYKYENQEFNFVEKIEISKLKDNVYYKDVFSA